MVCANTTHHGKYAWACVFACEAFICKSGTIYAETPSAIALHSDLLLLQQSMSTADEMLDTVKLTLTKSPP